MISIVGIRSHLSSIRIGFNRFKTFEMVHSVERAMEIASGLSAHAMTG